MNRLSCRALFVFLTVICLSGSGCAAPLHNVLSKDLQNEINLKPSGQKIPVILIFDTAKTSPYLSRDEMNRNLKEHARVSQKETLGLLIQKKKKGEAESVRSYWIDNSISLKATPALIRELAQKKEIVSIVRDQPASLSKKEVKSVPVKKTREESHEK
ncbi:MAG: hypothetical protein HYR80_10885 [Nitrospirae bacterium]|nr:hypothetical protein [Nitrospirota bacterium]